MTREEVAALEMEMRSIDHRLTALTAAKAQLREEVKNCTERERLQYLVQRLLNPEANTVERLAAGLMAGLPRQKHTEVWTSRGCLRYAVLMYGRHTVEIGVKPAGGRR